MAAGILGANHDNNHVAVRYIMIPSRKQSGAAEALAAAYLIGFGQRGRNPLSIGWQKVRMALGYVVFPFLR